MKIIDKLISSWLYLIHNAYLKSPPFRGKFRATKKISSFRFHSTFLLTNFRFRFFIDGWYALDQYIYSCERTMSLLVRELIVESQINLFLDVGANRGWYSLLAASNQVRTLSFEPNPYVRKMLSKNVDYNGYSSLIEVRQIALGDFDGDVMFKLSLDGSDGLSGIGTPYPKDELIAVEIATLDSLFRDKSINATLPGQSILKLDIEGFEFNTINGAQQYIRTCKPLIFVEINNELLWATSDVKGEDLFRLISDFGYQCYRISETSGLAEPKSSVVDSDTNKSVNYLMIPSEVNEDIVSRFGDRFFGDIS